MITAPLVVGVLGVVLIAMGLIRAAKDGNLSHPRTRTWVLVGAIFIVMSAYAFLQM